MYASTRLPSRPPNTIAPLPAERSFQVKLFASLPPAVHCSKRVFSAPTSIAVKTNMPSASTAAARPAYSIDVPWPCVFFPSGLNRWRVPVTTPRKMV